jgi:hypothetical protein
MTKFQEYARANYRPGGEIDGLWHPEIIRECEVMDREEREKKAMGEVDAASRDRNLDYLRKGYVIVSVKFTGSIAKTRKMTRSEVSSILGGLPEEKRESAKRDLDGLDKRLFSVNGFKELDDLVSGTQKLREQFKMLGYPFFDGQIIMKVSTFPKFVEMKERVRAERDRLVAALVEKYPEAITEEVVNSELYDPRDYRPVEAVSGLFGFKTPILGFASEELLADQVNESRLAEERAETVNLWNEVRQSGVALLRKQLSEITDRLVKSMEPGEDGVQRKFYSSTIEKMEEFFESFADRDLANDKDLAAEVERLRGLVSGKDVKAFKTDEVLRENVRKNGAEIQRRLSALVIEAGERQFDFS